MAKTTVAEIINKIRRRIDYVVTGDDNTVFIDAINDALKLMNQLFFDYQIWQEITASAQFKTVENQEYVDIQKARIVGNASTFTPVALDSITVTIDGTAYGPILMAGLTTIALIVVAINAATAAIGDVASESDDGYLVITSPTSGSTSSVTIASTAGTPASRLFTVAAERTQSAISNLKEIIRLSERNNDSPIEVLDWQIFNDLYTDPTASYATSPDKVARLANRLYLGPTPSANIYLYLDYLTAITEVTSGSTLPFSNDYDPILIAQVAYLLATYRDVDATQLAVEKGIIADMIDDLIVSASKNVGMRNQSASRNERGDYFAPRKPS